ncbi:hypothetical protein HDZ31DRAFT_76382 [Schizophyllum fasciatum]
MDAQNFYALDPAFQRIIANRFQTIADSALLGIVPDKGDLFRDFDDKPLLRYTLDRGRFQVHCTIINLTHQSMALIPYELATYLLDTLTSPAFLSCLIHPYLKQIGIFPPNGNTDNTTAFSAFFLLYIGTVQIRDPARANVITNNIFRPLITTAQYMYNVHWSHTAESMHAQQRNTEEENVWQIALIDCPKVNTAMMACCSAPQPQPVPESQDPTALFRAIFYPSGGLDRVDKSSSIGAGAAPVEHESSISIPLVSTAPVASTTVAAFTAAVSSTAVPAVPGSVLPLAPPLPAVTTTPDDNEISVGTEDSLPGSHALVTNSSSSRKLETKSAFLKRKERNGDVDEREVEARYKRSRETGKVDGLE